MRGIYTKLCGIYKRGFWSQCRYYSRYYRGSRGGSDPTRGGPVRSRAAKPSITQLSGMLN